MSRSRDACLDRDEALGINSRIDSRVLKLLTLEDLTAAHDIGTIRGRPRFLKDTPSLHTPRRYLMPDWHNQCVEYEGLYVDFCESRRLQCGTSVPAQVAAFEHPAPRTFDCALQSQNP